MLSEKEYQFIRHWEEVRVEYSKLSSKLLRGLPMALLFSLPVVILIAVVYFFSPDWYSKISKTTGSSMDAILIALIFIILFFSVARMHFKWEMNEQLYNELKARQNKQD